MTPLFALALMAAAPAGSTVAALDSLDKVKAFCEATRPTERVELKGDGIARGVARGEHEKRRAKMMETPQRVVLPSAAFMFGDYDPAARELPLDTTRGVWRTLGGAVSIFPSGADELALENVDEARAMAIAEAKKAGKAQLAVTFLPADAESGPCVANSTHKAFTLAVEPLTVELLVDDKPVARLETDAYQDFMATLPAPESGTPAVDVGTATVDGPAPTTADVRGRVMTTRTQLVDCYQKGLAAKPGLNGTVVVGFAIGKDGKPSEVEMAADSLLAPAVTDCAQGVIKSLSFPAPKELVRASVALQFARKAAPLAAPPAVK